MNDDLRQRLLEHMGKAGYLPQSRSELARFLDIPSKERSEFRQLVVDLEKDGVLVRLKKGTYALRKPDRELIEGRIKILRSGKVLFIPQNKEKMMAQLGAGFAPVSELPVQAYRLMSAMDGDRVAARIDVALPKGWRKYNRGRPSLDDMQVRVRVEKILERGKNQWVGVYRAGKGHGQVFGDGITSPAVIGLQKRAPQNLASGEIVVVTPVTWGEGRMTPEGYITEVLGRPENSGMDIEVVIRKYQLPLHFPDEVIDEVEALPDDLDESVLSSREDWTTYDVVTIDPEGARDFDDAVYVRKLKDGWELAVHIADVSHYVRPDSALDREAIRRGNSTYLPDRVIPMLPPRLSDDLCSLKEGEIRLTKVCVVRFNAKGHRIKSRFADAYIRNRNQMTYPRAIGLMKGDGTDNVSLMLKEAWNLASLLRSNRMAAGSLDLEFPEVRVLLDEQGVPVKVVTEEYDESHQLIEEFMLAANEAVAEALKNASRPVIYRIHEDPDEAKLNEFGELCKLYGHPVNDLGNRKNLMRLMASIKGAPDELTLKQSLLRSMMRARYDTEPLGHYGLAKTNYCHFTSPIRRYADLAVHRALNGLAGKGHGAGSVSHLQEIAEHISETERISSEAERESHRLKMFEWLAIQAASSEPEKLEALVSEVRDYGVFVEIPRLQIRGMIKKRSSRRSDWYHEGFADRWTNREGRRLQAGDKVEVIPSQVDREKQWVDFSMV